MELATFGEIVQVVLIGAAVLALAALGAGWGYGGIREDDDDGN